jgi:hypothetical protein
MTRSLSFLFDRRSLERIHLLQTIAGTHILFHLYHPNISSLDLGHQQTEMVRYVEQANADSPQSEPNFDGSDADSVYLDRVDE